MTAETEINPGARRPIVLCPWLVALAALALYGLTLNHWVTLGSLPFASQITGWDWHPGPLLWRPSFQPPLFFILTFPLRLLPEALRPIALNVFTALCAALTLAMLARSVRLFPHDRTREQRLREGGEHAHLSMRPAFLPIAFAALMLALELTFWENAVAATEEMLDLMVFAFLILCLLEFRASQSQRRLNLFALVYGLGMANNWALVGFFPCFLLALVWIKGLSFFNWRFMLRMTAWGLLGLLLYLMTPLLGAAAHDGGFWEILRLELGRQHYFLRMIPRGIALVIWAPVFLPLLFAAIKWPSFEGELSAGAHNLTRALFRVLHIVFLALGVLMFFDVKFSPNPHKMDLPGFLTFYYLSALSVGYFSGYVLLVSGTDVAYFWARAKGTLRLLNFTTVALLWVAAIAFPALLFYQNFPRIHALNSQAVAQFGEEMAKSLPAKTALVLGDDPTRLHLAAAACQRLGKAGQYVFIDTQSLGHREYIRFLADRYPRLKKALVNPDTLPPVIGDPQIADLLAHLSLRQPVYYLHPSFGYYFERSYLMPRGLGGDLKPYLTNALQMPIPSPEEIARNQQFFSSLAKGALVSLPDLAKRSQEALRVAMYYSASLNYWGAELQKAGTQQPHNPALLKDAGDQFAKALELNPDNLIARINLQFNASLRGLPPPPGQILNSSGLAARVNNWSAWLNLFGPADEPDLDLQIGRRMAESGDFLQAAHVFLRFLQLRPEDPNAELDLAKTFIDLGLQDAALDLARRLRSQLPSVPDDLVRVEALAHTKKGEFDTAEKVLVEAHNKDPKNENFLGVMIEFYRVMGYTALRAANGDPAREQPAINWFKRGLVTVDELLQLLNSPAHSTARSMDIPSALLKKAEMQMLVKNYDGAIATLTQVLLIDPENPLPLLNRAISELQANKLPAAKADYLAVEKLSPDWSYVIYFGLAQVAQKQKDNPSEIRYCKLYLQSAPHNTSEYTNVTQQLHKLESR
jgi:tetratricopeptide (TPR) repeat protein